MAEMHNKTAQQKRGVWITIAVIFGIIALFFSLFLHKMLSPRILSPAELRANGAVVLSPPRVVEGFELVDHTGEPFTPEDLLGKWTVAYFGFTHCPDICPTTLAVLGRVVAALDSDIAEQTQVIMVSVDPARDTPEKLAEYVPFFHPLFLGVTGDFLDIMKFTRQVGVAFNKVPQGETYSVDHTGYLILINPEGHFHAFYKPPFELARLKLVHQSIVSSY